MLRAFLIDFESNWERCLPLAKFMYNNNFQSSIQMALYEALYGLKVIRDRLKVASDRQKSYADLKRQDIECIVGDKVF
ncbi:DNA/RNA polymerases superfamily protein [Gossypium australe]|uniref:DNA/RNA polymerases superfamily protein n=1 Tax=Gossypium australe TaxID=47621 RepID=A0A5B6UX97_9ROSI|nr:DNA/RNA polymerases superfamily protein [Gossypium australe]